MTLLADRPGGAATGPRQWWERRWFVAILVMIALYSLLLALGLSIYWVIAMFGLFVAGTMFFVQRWHRRNCRVHAEEVEKLLAFARAESGHHH